jgi:hypothetical protein
MNPTHLHNMLEMVEEFETIKGHKLKWSNMHKNVHEALNVDTYINLQKWRRKFKYFQTSQEARVHKLERGKI